MTVGRFEEDFITARLKQLQMWIDRMCKHPIISRSEVFIHFLSCTDDKVLHPDTDMTLSLHCIYILHIISPDMCLATVFACSKTLLSYQKTVGQIFWHHMLHIDVSDVE